MTRSFQIEDVAAVSGFSANTLRYYEQIGLLPPSERSASGYRIYDQRTALSIGTQLQRRRPQRRAHRLPSTHRPHRPRRSARVARDHPHVVRRDDAGAATATGSILLTSDPAAVPRRAGGSQQRYGMGVPPTGP